MKLAAVRAGALALALVLLTFCLCFWLNGLAPALRSGEAAAAGAPAALTGWQRDEEGLYFDLALAPGQQAMLVYGALDAPLTGNGALLASPVPYAQFTALWQSGPARLRLGAGALPTALYLADPDVARHAVNAYNTLFGLGLGVTALMGLYALSLFWHKRGEIYLGWFAAYAGMLTLWSLGSLIHDPWGLGDFVSRGAYGWSALLNLFLCFRMFSLPLPSRRLRLPDWAAALAVLALWCLLLQLVPVNAWNLAHASLFFCSLPVLVWACAAGRRGAWLALTGQAVSQGLRTAIAVNVLLGQPIGFPLQAMQYAKLFNLPFLLCGMWIISRKFAEQFTQAERLSAQLEEANRGLEQKVEQRTRAMREQQTRRQAFMTNAFHDLRTPLFVVQGCLDQLGTGEVPGPTLAVMRDRLAFMRQLVEDMFLMAKLEEKQVIFDEDRVPLAPLAGRVCDGLRGAAARQAVRLTLEERDRCIAWGDELRLEQALQNLVTNALHHTPAGGVVTVRLYADGAEACLEVRDTGPGIPPEEQDKVFLRYYRSPGAKRRGSSGLGLSIAREIVVQHQGRITLASRLGEGAAFTIRLPAVTRPAKGI